MEWNESVHAGSGLATSTDPTLRASAPSRIRPPPPPLRSLRTLLVFAFLVLTCVPLLFLSRLGCFSLQMYDWVIYVQSNIVATVNYTINLWSQDESIMIYNATSPLTGQIVWLNGAPAPMIFIAEMVCVAPGTTRGMFQMEVGQAAPVTLLFKYTCALPLFNVGVQPFGTDIIAQGVYQAGWAGHSLASVSSTNLFVILDAANIAPSNPFNFRLISNDVAVTTPTVEDVGLNGNATKDGARSAQNPLVLTFNCAPCVAATASPIVYEIDWGWSVFAARGGRRDASPPPQCTRTCAAAPASVV